MSLKMEEYKPIPIGLCYGLSFAELCDRMQIVLLKIINSISENMALEQELKDIMNDIQIHLDNKPMDAEMVKGLIILGYVNKFIYDNESFIRDEQAENINQMDLLVKLKATHKANSLRGAAKKHIQNQRKERTDPKLNYGKEDGFWNIKW